MTTFFSLQLYRKTAIPIIIVVAVFMLLFTPSILIAQTETFVPLAELPGVNDPYARGGDIATFFNGLLRIAVVGSAFLAIIMIIVGGFQYMTSEVPGTKEDGKSRIVNAVGGLLLVLLSVLLLNIINPNILDLTLFT